MRRFLTSLLLIAPSLIFAMGSQPSSSLLIPAKIVDKEGKVHKVVSIVCNDKTFFTFKDGAVELKVPFERIDRLEILKKEGDFLKVKVLFKDGSQKEFLISSDVYCTGTTKYGTLEAYIDQFKEIDFLNQ